MSEIHLGARTQEQLGQETLTPEERAANAAAAANKPPELDASVLGAVAQNDRAPATFTEEEEARLRELEASGVVAPGMADSIFGPEETQNDPVEELPDEAAVQLEDDLARVDALIAEEALEDEPPPDEPSPREEWSSAIGDDLPASPIEAATIAGEEIDEVFATAILDLRSEVADLKDTVARSIVSIEADVARLREAIATSDAGRALALYEDVSQRVDRLGAFLHRATGVTPPS